jgi:hypothetical protein
MQDVIGDDAIELGDAGFDAAEAIRIHEAVTLIPPYGGQFVNLIVDESQELMAVSTCLP